MRTFLMLCMVCTMEHFEIHIPVIMKIVLVIYFIIGTIQDWKETK